MNDIKKVYDATKFLCGKKTTQSKPVKDKSGKILTSIEDQLKRWREHSEEVLNRPPTATQTTLQETPPLAIELVLLLKPR